MGYIGNKSLHDVELIIKALGLDEGGVEYFLEFGFDVEFVLAELEGVMKLRLDLGELDILFF